MRLAILVAILGLFFVGDAAAQTCVDPPTSVRGVCQKQSGAWCNPADRRWTGGNRAAFRACLAQRGVSGGGGGRGPACGRRRTVADCLQCSIDSGGLNRFPLDGIRRWCAQRIRG
jgi:hypothetical protein